MNVLRLRRRVAVTPPLRSAGALHVVVEVIAPLETRPTIACCCLSGGGMQRGYFDLQVGDDTSYSFAVAMVERGQLCVLVDSLGVGEGGQPEDGFELTPEVLADANHAALTQVLAELRAGTFDQRLPALPSLRSVGVGHSMGALLTAVQQARHRTHAGVALLGFSTRGMRDFNTPDENAYADDPAGARANVVRLARLRHPEPWFEIVSTPTSREVFGRGADRPAVAALGAVRGKCLATPSLFSMIPGSSAPDCAAIDVPVLLGIGDRDICGPPHAVPASFTASHDVTLLVLAETGHTHFVFPSRHRLFDRFGGWLATALTQGEFR